MDFRQAISIELLKHCRERGLTLPGLAARAGVPLSTLKNIISGQSANPGVLTLNALCGGLQIPLSKLLSDAEKTAQGTD